MVLGLSIFLHDLYSWIAEVRFLRRTLLEVLPHGLIKSRDDRECATISWELKRLPTRWFDYVDKSEIKPLEKGAEIGSLLRTVKKRKKSRRLGEVEVVKREVFLKRGRMPRFFSGRKGSMRGRVESNSEKLVT